MQGSLPHIGERNGRGVDRCALRQPDDDMAGGRLRDRLRGHPPWGLNCLVVRGGAWNPGGKLPVPSSASESHSPPSLVLTVALSWLLLVEKLRSRVPPGAA